MAKPPEAAAMRKGNGWRVAALIAIGLVVAAAVVTPLVLSLPQFGGEVGGERLARARLDPHYRDGRFVNPLPPAPCTWAYAWTLFVGTFFGSEVRVPPAAIPVVAVSPQALRAAPPGLRAFWIGHASLYVEIEGLRLLIDPVFSDYASPFAIGPKRFHPPPIALADLPPIDAVLITHDHYDHLDMASVQQLARSERTLFLVPLGIGAHLERWGVAPQRLRELEWGQAQSIGGVRFVSTPARHYSGRRLIDRNATLWTSWCAPPLLRQRRQRLLGSLRGDRRAVRAVRPRVRQGRRLRPRRAVARHPHERRRRGARGARRACQAPVPRALGHLQPRLPRLGRADPPHAGRGASTRRRGGDAARRRDRRRRRAVRFQCVVGVGALRLGAPQPTAH